MFAMLATACPINEPPFDLPSRLRGERPYGSPGFISDAGVGPELVHSIGIGVTSTAGVFEVIPAEGGTARAVFRWIGLTRSLVRVDALHSEIPVEYGDLENLVLFIARRIVGPEEARGLSDEVVESLATGLGTDDPRPGNVRQL